MEVFLNVLFYSLIAGIGTGIGGLIVMIRKPGQRSFGFLMGFAAGVMITLSFVELVNESWKMVGYLLTTIGFSLGALFMFFIDTAIPHIHYAEDEKKYNPKMLASGFLIAIGIAIHNIPEGIAVGAGYMHAPEFGLFIAIAIALHNIPEGIAAAVPLRTAGLCKWKSLKIACYTGLVEPIGALVAVFFLASYTSLIPVALAFAAGVMVFISLDELLPMAREHGHRHFTSMGIISGSILVFLLSGMFGV